MNICRKMVVIKIIYLVIVLILLIAIFPSPIRSQEFSGPSQPYKLEALDITFAYQDGKIRASGQVRFETADLIVQSDQILVDLNKSLIEASGENVFLITPEQELTGTYLKYNYESDTGIFYGSKGKIDELYFHSNKIKLVPDQEYDLEIEDVSFTTCKLKEPHYHFKAKSVEIHEQKVVAKKVEFWLRNIRLFTLPSYVVEYQETTDGLKPYNPTPLPHLAYNSKDGLSLKYYYPYQLSKKLEGRIAVDINQEGERKTSIDNSYQISPELVLTNQLLDSKEIKEDGSISKKRLLSNNLKFNRERINLTSSLGYDFLNHVRKEKIEINYYPLLNYRLNLYHDYNDEKLSHRSYSINNQGQPLRWELKQREGYDLDYLPYLELSIPAYQLYELNFKTRVGLGRVSNKGIMTDKIKLDLGFNKSIVLSPDFYLSLKGRIINNLYQEAESYQVYQSEITGSYRGEINQVMSFKTTLAYEINSDRGQAFLPDDKGDNGQFLKPDLDLTYFLSELESAWIIKAKGSYRLDTKEWKKAGFELTRQYDCHSLSIDYNLINNSFGFSIDF